MATTNKLMEMLTGYAAAHQHPFNVVIHMIGIPAIMLGVLIPMTWVSADIWGFTVNLGHLLIAGFFFFYLTLDKVFAIVFLIGSALLLLYAIRLGDGPDRLAWQLSAALFFGGYAAQFIGHAVEKSMPVLVKHPIQAQLAAPFFVIVDMFKFAGLREELFDAVQHEVAARRTTE